VPDFVITYGLADVYNGPTLTDDQRSRVRLYEYNGRTYMGHDTTDNVYACGVLCLSDVLKRERVIPSDANGLAVDQYGGVMLRDVGETLRISDFNGYGVSLDWAAVGNFPDYTVNCESCGDIVNLAHPDDDDQENEDSPNNGLTLFDVHNL
jgi:hypothetical protein